MGYDPSLSPEQTYNEEEGTTYADYFLSRLWTSSSRCPSCAARQKPRDTTLSAEGEQSIRTNDGRAHTQCVQSNAGSEELYLRMIYGRNMTKSLFKELLDQVHPGR